MTACIFDDDRSHENCKKSVFGQLEKPSLVSFKFSSPSPGESYELSFGWSVRGRGKWGRGRLQRGFVSGPILELDRNQHSRWGSRARKGLLAEHPRVGVLTGLFDSLMRSGFMSELNNTITDEIVG